MARSAMAVFYPTLVALLLAASAAVGQEAEFANNLEKCVVANRPLNTCLNNTLEELRTSMAHGIPSLNVRRMEPLEIPLLDFTNKDPPKGGIPLLALNISTQFRNVAVRGLSTFHTNDINADIARRVIYMSMTVPRLFISGLYRASGIIGFFHVAGDGSFESILEGVTGQGNARIVPVTQPDGTARISITDTNLDFSIARSNLKLKSNENRDLFEAVSGFINANSDILIEQLKPEIKNRMKVMVERVLNEAFAKIPANDVLKHFDVRPHPVPGGGPVNRPPPPVRSTRTLLTQPGLVPPPPKPQGGRFFSRRG